MNSIFFRTYKYKQTSKKNNLENFLIEIFTYCLETDKKFRESFFDLINLCNQNKYKISSQKTLPNGKRPDVFIETNDTVCLIECKVDAQEGDGQLDTYNEYLENQKDKKYTKLIYLTKYRSNIENEYDNFSKITWHDVYQCINTENTEITKELNKFLNEKKIALMTEFDTKDKLALTRITGSIYKMNEVLDSVKSKCEDTYSIKFKNTQRASKLKYGGYYDNFNLKDNLILDIGFFGLDSDEMTIGVRIYHPKNSNNYSVFTKNIQSALTNWTSQEIDTGYWIGNYILFNDENTILTTEKMIKFIFSSFSILYKKKGMLNIFE